MDLSVTRDTVRVSQPVFDAASDHPVDCDIILPDYCPDIARILKTEAAASIDSKTMEAGRMSVNGTFCVKILYIPENSRRIRCVTHETPFSHSFDMRETDGKTYGQANVRVAFVNCRPVGPRRLQIRASLSVAGKVWSEREENFVTGCDDPNVELLKKKLLLSSVVGMAERPVPVHEELEIGYGKPAASSIVKADALAMSQDYKVISNKVIAKGELLIKILYTPETEDEEAANLESMDYSLPLSQIIDLDGVDEDCGCEVKFDAGVVRAEPKPNGDGENRLIEVELTVNASAKAMRTQEVFAVSDAYSPRFEMMLEPREMMFEHMSDHIRNTEMIRQSITLENMQIASVTDIGVTAAVNASKIDAGNLELTGDMKVSILAADTGGGPVSVERTLPFTLREEIKGTGTMRAEPEMRVVSAAFSLAGPDRIDLRVECLVEAAVYTLMKENVVSEMNMDDENPKAGGRSNTLTLYYADKGERIWDIAKRYNTSMDAVKRENNLEDDNLDDRCMLLIPRKRSPKS